MLLKSNQTVAVHHDMFLAQMGGYLNFILSFSYFAGTASFSVKNVQTATCINDSRMIEENA